MKPTELGIYREMGPLPGQEVLRETAFEILSMRPSEFAKAFRVSKVYDDGDVAGWYGGFYIELHSRPATIRVADTDELTRNFYVAWTRRAGKLRRAVLRKAKGR